MGLREEIAKVRLARGRLEITRAKLQKLDEAQERVEQMVARPQQEGGTGQRRPRRDFELG